MRTRKQVIYTILLVSGIIILFNLLSSKYFFRLDFTEDQRYSLSEATDDILESLDETVSITAYFTENVPPNVAKVKQDFKDLLVEYRNSSGGNVEFEFIDPQDEEQQKAAQQDGVQPIMINVREKNEAKQQAAYLGAVISYGEAREVIPFVQPGAALEYTLSSSIKKLAVANKPKIGLIKGHGEAGLSSLRQANHALSVLYQVVEVDLMKEREQLQQYKTLAMIAPKDTINPLDFSILDDYMNKGGNLVLCFSPLNADFSTSQGSMKPMGVMDWLKLKGITVEPDFLIDANSGAVSVQQRSGFFSFPVQVPFPYFPKITSFTDHPITKGLESVTLQFASPIYYSGDPAISFTEIAKTSARSGTLKAPLFFDVQKQWTDADFPLPSQTIGAVFEGPIGGQNNAKMVVITNGNFAVSAQDQRGGGQLPADHVSLLVNSIDWLSDDTGLIDLRTKGITSRPLEEVEESKQTLIQYGNFLIPILLILLYGVYRNQKRKRERNKRREANYA